MLRAGPHLTEITQKDRRWLLRKHILPRIGSLRIDEIGFLTREKGI